MVLTVSCAHKEQFPALLARKTAAQNADRAAVEETYNKAVTTLKTNPEDLQQYVNLATAYVTEGRVTGNTTYYNDAALHMLEHVINSNTANKDIMFQALSLRSTVLLNYHQFRDAMDAAQKAVAINNFNAGIYGALVDANVELGNYEAAVQCCDKMMSIRPDLRSYSRASYLRQIYGQNRGAIQAMTMAVEAGMPGAENTEWARTTLGDLYLSNGNPDSANLMYRISLNYRPGYPHALMGEARVARAKKDLTSAIALTKQAIEALPEAAFIAQLAGLYEQQGNTAKAAEVRKDVLKLLEEAQDNEPKDAIAKHNAHREMANAYMHTAQLDKALLHAKEDLAMRPTNIDANQLVAWIYYLKGEYANAKTHIDKAFVTNTRSAELLYKASAIYAKTGNTTRSSELRQAALAVDPNIGENVKIDNSSALASSFE